MYKEEFKKDIVEFVHNYLQEEENNAKELASSVEKFGDVNPVDVSFKIFHKHTKSAIAKCQMLNPSMLNPKFFTFFGEIQKDTVKYEKVDNIKKTSLHIFTTKYFPKHKCSPIVQNILEKKKAELEASISSSRDLENKLLEISHEEGRNSSNYSDKNKEFAASKDKSIALKKEIEDINKIESNFENILAPIFTEFFIEKIDHILQKMNDTISIKLVLSNRIIWSKVEADNDVKVFFKKFQKSDKLDLTAYLNHILVHEKSLDRIKETKQFMEKLSFA